MRKVEMMRTPVIVGNWKMNKTIQEAVDFVVELNAQIGEVSNVEVAVAPPFTALSAVSRELQGTSIDLCAQDVHWEKEGAFTGEVSVSMLRDVGCQHVIVGHSERRQYFGENDAKVSKKVRAVLGEGLKPIVCVGESLDQRERGEALSVVAAQIRGSLAGLSQQDVESLIIAYEPVWAIGTGRTATPDQAEEMHGEIRAILRGIFGGRTAEQLRIQYGGSVKPENIKDLMIQPDIDGALVGGASLEVHSFGRIVKYRGK
jgi:triosephosphate isomerase